MSDQGPATRGERPEIAFYYPNPMWYSGDWIKSLILFFDGVGLLVPTYMRDRPEIEDPAIVAGLKQHGLLHVLEPETVVDAAATERLATAMTDIIVSGALDSLGKENTQFAELSYSRLGGYGDRGLANMIHAELKKRGLARDTRDGVSIPMHPMVRSLILVLLAQILRPHGDRLGVELSPATDRPEVVDALKELLSLPHIPSAGHVVAADLKVVGVDLASVPVDEVLSFRREHLEQHKAYARAARRFVRELSLLGEKDRTAAVTERAQELEQMARELANTSSKAWRQPASFALSVAGAAWTVTTGDPIGAVLAAGAALVGYSSGSTIESEVGAYSYLFSAHHRYATKGGRRAR